MFYSGTFSTKKKKVIGTIMGEDDIINEFLKVLPRINANGHISILPLYNIKSSSDLL